MSLLECASPISLQRCEQSGPPAGPRTRQLNDIYSCLRCGLACSSRASRAKVANQPQQFDSSSFVAGNPDLYIGCEHNLLVKDGVELEPSMLSTVLARLELNHKVDDGLCSRMTRLTSKGAVLASDHQLDKDSASAIQADLAIAARKKASRTVRVESKVLHATCESIGRPPDGQVRAEDNTIQRVKNKEASTLRQLSFEDMQSPMRQAVLEKLSNNKLTFLDNEGDTNQYRLFAKTVTILNPAFDHPIRLSGAVDPGSSASLLCQSIGDQFQTLEDVKCIKNLQPWNSAGGPMKPLYRLRLLLHIVSGGEEFWFVAHFDVIEDHKMPVDADGNLFKVLLGKKVCIAAKLIGQGAGSCTGCGSRCQGAG